jgi:hypothetical protein
MRLAAFALAVVFAVTLVFRLRLVHLLAPFQA